MDAVDAEMQRCRDAVDAEMQRCSGCRDAVDAEMQWMQRCRDAVDAVHNRITPQGIPCGVSVVR